MKLETNDSSSVSFNPCSPVTPHGVKSGQRMGRILSIASSFFVIYVILKNKITSSIDYFFLKLAIACHGGVGDPNTIWQQW